MDELLQECDVIVHLAGLNRHSDADTLYQTNIDLSERLIDSCIRTNSKPHIIFSSSTQEDLDNMYGKSKKKVSELFSNWSREYGGTYNALIIPNVFGPFGKPNYNSVVATFCHQIANGDTPRIIKDNRLNLIYINDLLKEIESLIIDPINVPLRIAHNYEISVSEILNKLEHFRQKYMWDGEFPNLSERVDLDLFNTFRCYIPHNYYPRPFIKHTDNRGYFVEIVRANTPGQFSFSTTKPNITRGNHFHMRKAERFAVIKGKARIQIRRIGTSEIVEYIIDGANPSYVDIPIWHVHNISNIGEEELIALFWISEPYNSNDSDTFYVNV